MVGLCLPPSRSLGKHFGVGKRRERIRWMEGNTQNLHTLLI